MREIKFRAWDRRDMLLNVFPTGTSREVWSKDEQILRKVEAIMQYTELTDKNGVEIYEGDILVSPHTAQQYEIVFHQGCFKAKGMFLLDNRKWAECDILGNIHQHPHLLTDK